MEQKGQVIVYTVLGCPHCMRAKGTLREFGLTYTEIRLDLYQKEVREDLRNRTGKQTVPQIFFNDRYIGGNAELQKMVSEGKLDSLVDDVVKHPPGSSAPASPDPKLKLNSCDPVDFTCELDECAQLVVDLQESGIITDHRKGFSKIKRSFSGKDFVDWIVQSKELDRQTAVEMGQSLIDRYFGHHYKSNESFVDGEVYYRLLEDAGHSALNGGPMTLCEPRRAPETGEELRKQILKLYSQHLSADGKKVDYSGIHDSIDFQGYVSMSRELQRINVQCCSRNEKLAFFINVYNALVIHGIIVRGSPSNVWQRYKFFNTVSYIIGGLEYSLQDIENGILRCNRKGVGMFFKPFSGSDPRLCVALDSPEPLIHFGLVCGSRSCPPIKTYTSDGVLEELRAAAESFLDGPDGCVVDPTRNCVHLSMILKWYQEDFGRNLQEVLLWVFNHVGEGETRNYLKMVKDNRPKVAYMKYDWSINH